MMGRKGERGGVRGEKKTRHGYKASEGGDRRRGDVHERGDEALRVSRGRGGGERENGGRWGIPKQILL